MARETDEFQAILTGANRSVSMVHMTATSGNLIPHPARLEARLPVFTSACHSVAAGVPHVVSIYIKFEVSDEGAMTFTNYFYEALL